MLNLHVHPGSPEVFCWIRVAQSSLGFCIVFCRSLFVIFLLSIVYTPIYGFCLPLWYHQTYHCIYSYLQLSLTPLVSSNISLSLLLFTAFDYHFALSLLLFTAFVYPFALSLLLFTAFVYPFALSLLLFTAFVYPFALSLLLFTAFDYPFALSLLLFTAFVYPFALSLLLFTLLITPLHCLYSYLRL